ncbi:MAG: alpha/beta hydrolase [Myxococcota bacterium]|nr:alpha/beta hydrolase [Myxococcota bacterium]
MFSEALRRPALRSLARESQALRELPRLAWHAADLARQPRGRGEPVVVLPGFGTGDESTVVLRAYLRGLGYRVRGWGLGRNDGDVPALIPRVADLVARAADATGRVRLVGWSLGGYLAREAARERPEAVEQVVTLGTPVVGGPKYTLAAAYFAGRGYDLDEIEAEVERRDTVPLDVPVTAIYSRSDAVVAWEACIDRRNAGVEHVEVESTHVGLGINPDVFRIVAHRLARARGDAGAAG